MKINDQALDDYEKALMDEINDPNFAFVSDQKIMDEITASPMLANLAEEDKTFLAEEAQRLGVPYPIMLSSAIHQFVEMSRKKKKELS